MKMKGEASIWTLVSSVLVFGGLFGGFLAFYSGALTNYGQTPIASVATSGLTNSYNNMTVKLQNISSAMNSNDPQVNVATIFDPILLFFFFLKDIILGIPNIAGSMITDLNSDLDAQWKIPVILIGLMSILIIGFFVFKIMSLVFKRSDT